MTRGTVHGDQWACPCGAEGTGGLPALTRHAAVLHGPRQLNPLHPVLPADPDQSAAVAPAVLTRIPAARGSVVPDGINSRHVRAWAKAHGWPLLGDRGRLPQDAIDEYVQEIKCRTETAS